MQPNTDQFGQPIQPAPEPMLIGSPQPAVVGGGMGGGRPTQMMNPLDAVVSCLKHTVTFNGRASRSEFWWFLLAFQIASFVLTFVAVSLAVMTEVLELAYLSYLTYLLYPAYLSAAVRRMHDHGKSGWWILCPIYNIVLWATEGEAVPNSHGPVPTNVLAQ
jgi:uncharacterized membrane protein YhaH (DUF805 family)